MRGAGRYIGTGNASRPSVHFRAFPKSERVTVSNHLSSSMYTVFTKPDEARIDWYVVMPLAKRWSLGLTDRSPPEG